MAKFLTLRMKELEEKDIRKEMTDGLKYVWTDDCDFSMCQEGEKYHVLNYRDRPDKKSKKMFKSYTFDNLDNAIEKFKKIAK